jgi:glycosyltransferase involved in cell wall biosynthesis
MMRIGVLGHGFVYWGGGLDFLRMVCGSLHACDADVELHLLMPTAGPRLRLRKLAGKAWRTAKRGLGQTALAVRSPDPKIIDDFVASTRDILVPHVIDIGEGPLLNVCRRLGLHALVPSMLPLKHTSLPPWLGYIPDFQHVHLPHYFAQIEIDDRNRLYGEIIRTAPAIVVNSEAVARDIRSFAPDAAVDICSLPFSAAPDPAWLESAGIDPKNYGIDGPYFLISNQFWQHKDHATAYRAFSSVLSEYPGTNLVCTGETHDYRNTEHFAGLCALADSLGLARRLRVLGLIPKLEQISLMRSSVAVIQPTLCEGGPGGGSVYDAIALGVPVILSDIPINLEIRETGVSYFKSGDADSLAARMKAHLSLAPAPRPSNESLSAAGYNRRHKTGAVLLQAIDMVARRAG